MANRKVCFLIGNKTASLGSVYLRSIQLRDLISVKLLQVGHASFVTDQIDTLADCVVIISKSALVDFDALDFESLRKRNNLMLIDPLDLQVSKINLDLCDHIIACSKSQAMYYRQELFEKRTFYIPHHVDLRIVTSKSYLKDFKCAYFGTNFNCLYLNEIVDKITFFSVHRFEETSWLKRLDCFNAHYAVRARQSFDGFKPFTKGFIAATQRSVLILSKDDEEAMLHVGKSYPFAYDIVNHNQAREAIDDVKLSFETHRWQTALEIMDDVNAMSSHDRVITSFLQMMSDLSQLEGV